MSASSATPVIRRSVLKASKAREDRLRNAISLYHLSPSFYPTSARNARDSSSSQASTSSETLDKQLDRAIRIDLFGNQGERSLLGEPYELTKPPQFSTGDNLMTKLNQASSRGPKDGSDRLERIGEDVDTINSDLLYSSSNQEQDQLSKMRKSFLSNESTFDNIPTSQTRPSTHENGPLQHHIQISSSAAVRQGQLDERTAKIRDALFGTVGAGERPGLEAVRARARKAGKRQD
ncbi:unnamed protein product [Sympodiomycopsis kandeliae]